MDFNFQFSSIRVFSVEYSGQARHIIPEIKFILIKYFSGYNKIVHFTKLETRIKIPLCWQLQTSLCFKFSFCG